MFVKPQLKQLRPYVPGKSAAAIKEEYGLDDIIKLASNENPYGASPKAHEVFGEFDAFNLYPDGAAKKLKQGLADFLEVQPNQLLIGAGADEVIQMLSRAILKTGDRIVQGSPTFIQYAHHATIEDAQVVSVPLKDGAYDLEALAKKIDEKTKIVWICNPNNPTGTYVSHSQLEAFLASVPKTVLVAVDEAYVEYVAAADFPDALALLSKYPNLFILRTFSKIYGLASFRVGYGIGSPALVQELEVARLPFNTTAVSQKVAAAALKDQAFVADCHNKNRVGMAAYESFFASKNVPFYPSETNFIFATLPDAQKIASTLESKGLIIRPFPEGIRITIGTEEQNEQLLAALSEIL